MASRPETPDLEKKQATVTITSSPSSERSLETPDLKEKEAIITVTSSPISERSLADVEKHIPSLPDSDEEWEQDPENPMNWPLLKKSYHLLAISVLAFSVTCGSSLITPSVFIIMSDFQVQLTNAILVLSLFVLGLCFGPMIGAPISETKGRNCVYYVSSIACMVFIIGAGFSTTFSSLLACRFFAGMFGAPVLAVGSGTAADMFRPEHRAVAGSIFVGIPFLGPSIGPVIGGFVATNHGSWQWTQYVNVMIAAIAFLMTLPMQETYKKIILKRRAAKLGLPSTEEEMTTGQKLKLLFTITLFRPIRMIFTEPIVSLFALYNALSFGILFSLFEAFPYTYMLVYGFQIWQWGLTFLGVGFGVALAVFTTILVDKVYYQKHHKLAAAEGRTVAPEYRLLAGQLGSFGIPIGLFWFAWTARADIHFMVPVMAGVFFAWGNVCVFISGCLYLVDVYGPQTGASALAANGLLRYMFAAAFPLFTVQMYENLGIGWASSTFGFATMLMIPIPFVFFAYGPQLRAKSSMT